VNLAIGSIISTMSAIPTSRSSVILPILFKNEYYFKDDIRFREEALLQAHNLALKNV